MKRILYILSAASFFTQVLHAQHIVTASGIFHQNASGAISFIIGDIVTTSGATVNNLVNPGIQSSSLEITAVNDLRESDVKLAVYPNPASETVKLNIGREVVSGFQYRLYDLKGLLLKQEPVEKSETEIFLGELPPSTYFIKILDGKREIRTFKIVKY